MEYTQKLQWQSKLRDFQITNEIPYWKFSYVESLLSKSFDFYDVGQDSLGERTLVRVAKWLETHKNSNRENVDVGPYEPFTNVWSHEWFGGQLNLLRDRLQDFRHLIPRFEFDEINHNFKLLSEKLNQDELRLEELNELRIWVIDRIHQSYGAIGDMEALKSIVQSDIQIDGIGPYNNRYNFGEAFKILSSADPLWVGDFLDLYNTLFGLEDKVASTVIKRK